MRLHSRFVDQSTSGGVVTFAPFGATPPVAAVELLILEIGIETAAFAPRAVHAILTVSGAQLAAVLMLIVI